MRSRLLLPLLLALAGCADEAPGTGAGEPAAPGTLLGIDASGVGALSAETPFSPEAVRAALPEGFEIETGRIETERDTVPVLYAFSDGQIILEVFPDRTRDRVGRIDAASALVAGPQGARPGDGFSDVGGGGMDCQPGTEELAGRAVCRASGGGPVRYVFAHGADTPRGALPERDVLAQSILERIVWERR